jgi:hypothetical protein
MTKVFGYKELDANQLVIDYKETGLVTIKLQLRPASIVLKLAKIYRSFSPRSREPLTTFSNIRNIFSLIWLNLKIRIFYKNLQEVNKFLYASLPDKSENRKTGDTLVLTFSKCNYELEEI